MARAKVDERTGNAILVCACGAEVDKGCPPIPGQDDSNFTCEDCQGQKDAIAIAERVAAAGGPVEIKG